MLNNVQFYYFSPTGGTKACGDIFCEGVARSVKEENLGARAPLNAPECELTVFAAPVFGGRIPAVAAEKIASLNGAGRMAVTIAVYGTRAYEDALLELNDAAASAGFRVVASAAVVARHSIVPAVGQGRPDEDDRRSITEFAENVLKKLMSGDETVVSVPGNFPYKESRGMPVAPVCLPECSRCGECESVCPTAAICMDEDGVKTDADACILCLACASVCPEKARILPPPMQERMNEGLSALIPIRRENEYFL